MWGIKSHIFFVSLGQMGTFLECYTNFALRLPNYLTQLNTSEHSAINVECFQMNKLWTRISTFFSWNCLHFCFFFSTGTAVQRRRHSEKLVESQNCTEIYTKKAMLHRPIRVVQRQTNTYKGDEVIPYYCLL